MLDTRLLTRRRSVPAALPFSLLAFLSVVLDLSSAFELAAGDNAVKFSWYQFGALIKVPFVTLALIFVLTYVGPARQLTRTVLALLAIPCVIVAALIVTDPWHHLTQSTARLGQDVSVMFGPTLSGATLYVIHLFLIGVVALSRLWFQSPQSRCQCHRLGPDHAAGQAVGARARVLMSWSRHFA